MRFLRDTHGITSVEYGVIAGALGLVLIAIFHSFGGHLSLLFIGIGKAI